MLPFGILLASIATLPTLMEKTWQKPWFQILIVLGCAIPVIAWILSAGLTDQLTHASGHYLTFVLTLTALYVTTGGIRISGDMQATPAVNLGFVAVGSVLASVIGTTGAAMLLVRPVLATNRQRKHASHVLPLFIMAVANAGGLLTPIGDPPLLIGFLNGVPFFWTLRLIPFWALYVGTILVVLWVMERRAYAREPEAALLRDAREVAPLKVEGFANIALLLVAVACVVAAPTPLREIALVAIAIASYLMTPKERHKETDFSFLPMAEVGILFVGIFACLIPVEAELNRQAATLPIRESWQFFWLSGGLSAVLDNAPTYAAFTSLGKGVSVGMPDLVAGIAPNLLTAVSIASVTMGAMTYIGNGPNLLVKAVAERSDYPMPSFLRYSAFAFVVLLPAHLLTTAVLFWMG